MSGEGQRREGGAIEKVGSRLAMLARRPKTLAVIAYVAVTLGLSGLMAEYRIWIVEPMAGPILKDSILQGYSSYEYLFVLWLAAAGLLWLPKIGPFVFLCANSPLLGNAYFAIAMRVYGGSTSRLHIYLSVVGAIIAMLLLRGERVKNILIINAVALFSTVLLALQYAIVVSPALFR